MVERDDDAPSTSASAGALRPLSKEEAELEARAAEAKAAEQSLVDEAARKQEAARQRERDKRVARARDDARAPTGFMRSMRAFTGMMGGMLLLVGAATNALEGPLFAWRSWAVVTAVWASVMGALALDARTWRRRLGFALDGFDHISGVDASGSDRAPWVRFEVRVVPRDDDSAARAACARVLEILASRVNVMIAKDKDLSPSEEQRWRVDAKGACTGESTLAIYTTRLIEKWLRSDVALHHRTHAVARVEFRARYTGASTRIPD